MENQLMFTIEESVLFQREQEIGDILSISLEPDIAVEEAEEYVSITGTLQLRGTFRLNTLTETAKEQDEALDEQMSVRFVKEVRALTNETAEFLHEFPVEITIPSDRITALDDIYVVVNSFDYELPNERNLQLTAELAISGIEEEQPEEMNEEETAQITELHVPILEESLMRTEETEDKSSFDNLEDATFEVEVKQQVEEVEEVEEDASQTTEEVSVISEPTIREDESAEGNIPHFELKSRPQEEVELADDRIDTIESASIEGQIDEVLVIEGEELASDDADDEGEDGRENADEVTEDDSRDENTLYLTKMLAREDGERFSKLRMRIIQPGESLDSIAEAYNVSLSHLVRSNRLEDHSDIEEGQILYIPANTESE